MLCKWSFVLSKEFEELLFKGCVGVKCKVKNRMLNIVKFYLYGILINCVKFYGISLFKLFVVIFG